MYQHPVIRMYKSAFNKAFPENANSKYWELAVNTLTAADEYIRPNGRLQKYRGGIYSGFLLQIMFSIFLWFKANIIWLTKTFYHSVPIPGPSDEYIRLQKLQHIFCPVCNMEVKQSPQYIWQLTLSNFFGNRKSSCVLAKNRQSPLPLKGIIVF